jgi:hypothetical protein
MSKADRRARKKANRAKKQKIVTCDGCGFQRPDDDGDHDTAWSRNGATFEGIAVVAWCEWCGCDTCH